jgi:hypothetical protein
VEVLAEGKLYRSAARLRASRAAKLEFRIDGKINKPLLHAKKRPYFPDHG